MGDPVNVDLVFSGTSPNAAVVTTVNPYLPVSDRVDIQPLDGWVRTHTTIVSQSLAELPQPLGAAPIRVPILLNRDINFVYATRYSVTVTTERLRTATPEGFAPGEPETTNALAIDILPRRDADVEPALVASLSRRLDDISSELANDRKTPLKDRMTPEQRGKIEKQIEAFSKVDPSTPEGKAQAEALLPKMNAAIQADLTHQEQLEAERRALALRLAYLPGDEATRVRIHFIAADPEKGEDAAPIGPIFLDGLPSSQNKRLQLDLLEDAWQDPDRVPTHILQTALRQAKELMHSSMVTSDALLWAGNEDERQAALEENRREIDEIQATLDLRTPENRVATIAWLKAQAVPNQFNRDHLPANEQ